MHSKTCPAVAQLEVTFSEGVVVDGALQLTPLHPVVVLSLLHRALPAKARAHLVDSVTTDATSSYVHVS